MKEYEFEPLRGLPEHLPPGEEMLWQGAPRWSVLARRAFHVRKVAVYFALLVALRIATGLSETTSVAVVLKGAIWIVVLGGLAIGCLVLLAWAMARTTVYTITNRRLVMRIGVALPMMMNLPFKQVRSADLKLYPDGAGDIPLLLAETAKPSYVIFWPHVRPWHFSPPQPMLRAIPDARQVAGILAGALAAYVEHPEGTAEGEADDAIPAVVRAED